ncbi:alpha/beta hydrolase [Nonomuraea wenchangensis]|uniref:alpha/beta hydrolase n=1 Tax=Nonomuraea wenchangensis TaxID=568860 RepID=UPI0033DEF6B8
MPARPEPADLDALLAEGGPVLTESAADGQTEVTFVTTGDRSPLSLWIQGVRQALPQRMRRLGPDGRGRQVWAYGARFPSDSTLTYCYVERDPFARLGPLRRARLAASAGARDELIETLLSRSFPDPAAPRRVPNVLGLLGRQKAPIPATVSDWVTPLALPGAPGQDWRHRPVRLGRLVTERPGTGPLARPVTVYRPPRRGEAGDLPLVVVFDGEAFAWLAGELDEAIARGRMPAFLVAYVHNLSRRRRIEELSGDPGLVAALVSEIVPWLRARYDAAADPARVIVAGAGLGGLAAARLAHQRPDLFGAALVMSGSLWWEPRGRAGRPAGLDLLARLARERRHRWPIRLWMSYGTLEADVGDRRLTLLGAVERFARAARPHVDELTVREFPGGHDTPCWRPALRDGLRHLTARWRSF